MLALQRLHQARTAQRLRIQALSGQEENREIGGVRGGEVLFADRARLQPQARLQRARRGLGRCGVGAVLRIEQALVVLTRELRVDRQPHRRAALAAAGQAQRELHARAAARHGLDIGGVLRRREDLLQQGGELHLAVQAARLDVAEHPAERADVARQALHLAQALVHLLQALGHLAEALAQALLQRGVQLLVDGRAHLLELAVVAVLQRLQPRLDRRAQLGQALVGALRHPLQQLVLGARGLAALRQQQLLQAGEVAARGLGLAPELVAQLALQALETRVDLLGRRGRAPIAVAPQQHGQVQQRQRGQRRQGDPGRVDGTAHPGRFSAAPAGSPAWAAWRP